MRHQNHERCSGSASSQGVQAGGAAQQPVWGQLCLPTASSCPAPLFLCSAFVPQGVPRADSEGGAAAEPGSPEPGRGWQPGRTRVYCAPHNKVTSMPSWQQPSLPSLAPQVLPASLPTHSTPPAPCHSPRSSSRGSLAAAAAPWSLCRFQSATAACDEAETEVLAVGLGGRRLPHAGASRHGPAGGTAAAGEAARGKQPPQMGFLLQP